MDVSPNISDIAWSIFGQFGGTRTLFMIGGTVADWGENYIAIKFKMFPKANIVKIKYEKGSDLYTIIFYKYRANEIKEVKKFEEVYADQLTNIFEDYTGLYTKL